MRPELSVAMIVRDEQESLPGALASLEPPGDLLEEVCVYDTGSVDDTVALARSWGARVEEGYWDDDFARARNDSLRMVETRWALILDSDDRFYGTRHDVAGVLDQLRDTDASWLGAVTVDDVRNGVTTGSLVSQRAIQPRSMWCRGRVHERVTLREGNGHARVAVINARFVHIERLGYGDQERNRAKGARKFALAAGRVTDAVKGDGDTDVAHALRLIGRAHLLSGDLLSARKDFEDARSVQGDPLKWRAAGEEMARLMLRTGDHAAAGALVEQPTREGSDSHFVNYIRVQVHSARGELAAALQVERRMQSPRTTFHVQITAAAVLTLRGRAVEALGDGSEVMATALALLAHSHVARVVDVVLRIWAARPLQVRARVVVTDMPGEAEQLVVHLRGAGRKGQELRELLLAEAGTLTHAH